MSSGLGRGLDSLIPGGDIDQDAGINEVAVNLIDVNPYQPRTVFNEDELKELADSIKRHGLLQPLVVSPKEDHYELIAGERRLRASKLAGLNKVPVIVRDVEDHEKLEIAIIENVHRANLNPIDEALSYRKLTEEFGYTQEKVAEVMGKSRVVVTNKLRLLTLSSDIKKALKEMLITEGHAKALLSVEDLNKRQALFESILAGKLNVREVEKLAASHKEPKNQGPADHSEDDLALKHLSRDLETYLGAKVFIKRGPKAGKIEIDFYSTEELNRIYQIIKGVK
jgi:ParB family chromosome partitioning protein